ncbi:MAG: phosphopantetheine-binding protein [bacterium]
MTKDEVVTLTNLVFEESFEIDKAKLTPQAKIFDELGLDSLDIVDLIVALQKKFKVQIREDERVRSIRTLDDIYTFILTLKQEEEQKRPGG